MNKCNRPGKPGFGWLLFIMLFMAVWACPLQALQQLQYPTFTANWDFDNQVVEGFALTQFGLSTPGNFSAACYQGGYKNAPGGPAMEKADGFIEWKFPVSPKAASTNILIRYSVREYYMASTNWTLNMSGTIRDFDNTSTVYNTFLNRSKVTGEQVLTYEPATWTGTLSAIPVADKRLFRIYWNIGIGNNNDTVGAQVSDVYLHMSPDGLTVTEDASGFFLNWNDSNPGTGALCPGLATIAGAARYRIYRRTDPATPWLQVGTCTTSLSEWTDLSPPASETVYYCVSDVDTTGYESPKSPEAQFKPAKLVIEEVSSAFDSVTIGQTVLVDVKVLNSGYSNLSLHSLSLVFEGPASAAYTIVPPTLPVSIDGGATQTLSFQVKIEEELTDPGLETIDAQGLATATVRNISLTTTGSLIKKGWTIRDPATLKVTDVIVPERVYRGQVGAPINITAMNNGGENAAGEWLTSAFEFDPGASDFTNLRLDPAYSLPVSITADNYVTMRYLVDISPNTATGQYDIGSRIWYQDVNLRFPRWTNWDDSPLASWTVLAGIMKTYRSSTFIVDTTTYNQGNYKVYAKAENLQPLTSHRFRFYDPSDPVNATFTSGLVQTNDVGAMTYEYQLSSTSPLGKWRVVATRPLTTTPLAENDFWVVSPASLSIKLAIPPVIVNGRTFNATMTMSNLGGAGTDPAIPGTMISMIGSVGTANMIASPANQAISGLGVATFSWNYTATGPGSFTVQAKGYGYDANNSQFLETATATSNMSIITSAPNLSVTGVTEGYVIVATGQQNLNVSMAISNTGGTPVYVTAASLTFNAGTHFQAYASPPVMPFILSGNSNSTIVFSVAVASSSVGGIVNPISGTFAATEVYDSTRSYGVPHGGVTGSWTIGINPYGECGANVDCLPQQYNFNQGQRIHVKFHGIISGETPNVVSILFFDDETVGAPGTEQNKVVGTLRGLTATSGNVGGSYLIPAAGAIKKWRVACYDHNGTGGTQYAEGAPLAIQYFWVEEPGQLIATLTISPDTVDLGGNITVTMSLANEPTGNSVVYPATSSLPVGLPTGGVSWVSGPTPASVSVQPGYPATFTWVYQTTAYSAFSTFQMIATATGIDKNSTYADPTDLMVASDSATSNAIKIYARSMTFTPDPLTLGTMISGETKVINGITLTNTGNATMTNLQWQRVRPETPEGEILPLSSFDFSPDSGFTLSAPGNKTCSFTLTLPYNQASGTYESVMRVYDDLNSNTQRDAGEPFASFTVTLIAAECKVIVVSPQAIDLGGWAPNSPTTAKTVSVFSGGNIDLDNVRFKEIASESSFTTISVVPDDLDVMAAGSVTSADVSAVIGAEASGIYIATWTVWNDSANFDVIDAGEASATFQVQFSIGVKDFDATPNPLALGAADPDSSIENVSFTIRNNLPLGELDIITPAAYFGSLVNIATPSYTINLQDNLVLELPTGPIASGETRLATLSLFIPPGTGAGDYAGDITLYDDEDGDGSPSGTEYDLHITVTVNPFFAISVLPSTVNVGGVSRDSTKVFSFQCMNIGSAEVASLSWGKIDLAPAPFIPMADYSFTGPLSVGIGQLFYATITINIDPLQAYDEYEGAPAWLYNDLDGLGKDGTDAQDSFAVKCQVGNFYLDVIETSIAVSGVPNALSGAVTISAKNTGNLDLELPKARAEGFLVDTGDPTNMISSSTSVFTPAVFSGIPPLLTRYSSWAVQTPCNATAAVYEGLVKVWNDDDADGVPDQYEASDTLSVSLEVLLNKSMEANPDPCELPVTKSGATVQGTFVVQNTGNELIAVSSITPVKLDLTSGGSSIPAINVGFSAIPANIPYFPTADTYATITATVIVPVGQIPGTYEGIQVITYDGKQETIRLRLIVGEKKILVTDPVDFGTRYPKDVFTKDFTVKNESLTIPLESMRWLKNDLESGANTFPTSMFAFSSTGFSVGTNQSKVITASVTIPVAKEAGAYIATQTAYDDQNLNLGYDAGEGSDTFQIHLTIGSRAILTIASSSIVMGDGAAGSQTITITAQVMNEGNVLLDDLVVQSTDLTGPGAPIPGANVLVSPSPVVDSLAPGATANMSVYVNVATGQTPGVYTGKLKIWDSVLYPGYPLASCSRTITVNVIPGLVTGPDLASGAIYQEVATLSFSTVTPETIILSAYVAATGSVGIGFLETLPDGSDYSYNGIVFDFSTKTLTQTGAAIVDAAAVPVEVKDGLNWYRLYVSFNYKFVEANASNTYIIMKNATSDAAVAVASYSAWFDGIQLEKAVIPGQTKPTVYSEKGKLISPSDVISVDGKARYYEW